MKLFAIRDLKADAFGSVIALPTVGVAGRYFTDVCMNPQGPISKYPEDYQLYEIGDFDPISGFVDSVKPAPKYIMSALEARALAPRENNIDKTSVTSNEVERIS